MNRFIIVFLLSLFSASAFAQNVADKLLVDASDATWGNPDAPVTIVMYSDLQCPFCFRAHTTLDTIEKKYTNVRFVFRHFPLAFHKQAEDASRATIAAQKQGKFREMHNVIFKNQRDLRKNAKTIDNYLRGIALQVGLDEVKFMSDYSSSSSAKKVQKDMASGKALGVRGTPHFFINGERLSGAQPLSKFEKAIDAQLAAAALLKGMTNQQRYEKLVRTNFKKKVQRPKDIKVQYVPIDKGDPIWGSKKALVTIIEFSEFQCPFCERVSPTLKKLKKKYGNKLRIVYKQNPLSFHKQARQASRAALSANKQGKFLKMKDLLYKNYKKFAKTPDMDALMMTLGKKAGLKMGKFETDYYSDEIKAQVQKHIDQAKSVGATGTPSFFINGVRFNGAQPYDKFVPVIDQQMAVAKKIRKRERLSGNKLYRAVVTENEKNEPPKIEKTPIKNKDTIKALKKLKKPFWKGKKNAKVVIHMMSDFQCPYCKRASVTMDELYGEYSDRVKFVFVNVYLPFHKDAKIAHLAAIAAGRQGKFWQMHDKIFKRGKEKITQALLDRFAEELNLNMKRFGRDRVSSKTKKQLIREGEIAKKAGLRGTPNFNINGEMIVGAQPVEKFREILNRFLKK